MTDNVEVKPKDTKPAPVGIRDQDVRTYVASAIFILLVLLLMLFLTFVEIPSSNKDLIVSIISMLVGGTGVALAKLFGESNTEADEMRKEIAKLKVSITECNTRYSVLKSEYDDIVQRLVTRIQLGAMAPEVPSKGE